MSVFLQFDPPGPTGWLYATFAVAVAVLFQFRRPLVLRNWDLLALFAFAPGFLFVFAAQQTGSTAARLTGYIWLLAAAGWWQVRCFLDAWVVRRPRVAPNLATPALFWLTGAVLVGMSVAVFSRPTAEPAAKPAALNGVEQTAAAVVEQARPEDAPPGAARLWVSRGIAVACQAAVVTLLILICRRHFQDATTAATAAALYVLLPVTWYQFDQWYQVWPTAFVLGAILGYRSPPAAGVLLGLAAGTTAFPLVLVPAWVQFYHGRGSGRFVVWFAGTFAGSLLLTAATLTLGGEYASGVWHTLSPTDWQPWVKPTADSVWTGGRWYYRLPVFVAYTGLVLGTFIWPKARNLGELLAVNAAALIGIQFWFADRGGVYVLWFAPLLILMVLRPTATDLVPPPVNGVHLFRWLRKPKANGLPSPGVAV